MPTRQSAQGYNLPLQADASYAVSAPPNHQVPRLALWFDHCTAGCPIHHKHRSTSRRV
ncbi:hypothetical protein Hanom_Chr05g00457861 [Helianthus anomalus]